MLMHLFWSWSHVTDTPLSLLRPVGSPPALSFTITLGFSKALGIRLFNSLKCDLREAMPRQRSLALMPREAEDFPRGDKNSKHVSLPTYLA